MPEAEKAKRLALQSAAIVPSEQITADYNAKDIELAKRRQSEEIARRKAELQADIDGLAAERKVGSHTFPKGVVVDVINDAPAVAKLRHLVKLGVFEEVGAESSTPAAAPGESRLVSGQAPAVTPEAQEDGVRGRRR